MELSFLYQAFAWPGAGKDKGMDDGESSGRSARSVDRGLARAPAWQ